VSVRWSPKHLDIARQGVRTVLIKWVMDHRFNPDPNDRFAIEMTGCTTPEKARRIWAILQEPEPNQKPESSLPAEATHQVTVHRPACNALGEPL
jgi:hypothetical protein